MPLSAELFEDTDLSRAYVYYQGVKYPLTLLATGGGGGGGSDTGALVNSGSAVTMTTNVLEIGSGVTLPFSVTLPTTPTQWKSYKVYNATGSVGPINVLGTINNANGTITINSVGGAATFFYDGTQYCRTA